MAKGGAVEWSKGACLSARGRGQRRQCVGGDMENKNEKGGAPDGSEGGASLNPLPKQEQRDLQ